MKLSDIAYFVEEKISSENIKLEQYVTTDSLLQNKKGRTIAQNLPPQRCSLVHFKEGDVLLGNIRPYLKKIWYANIEGGCSQDVLVLRAKNNLQSKFLYALLMQDSFFEYEMKATKGSKMPRGDKSHIINFPCLDLNNKTEIGKLLSSLDEKIALNNRINAKLEQMAKRLYDYWFVQFDFSGADGKPYKSNGGKMVWNEELKRKIPEGWEVKKLGDLSSISKETMSPYNFPNTVFKHFSIPGFDECNSYVLETGKIILSDKFITNENQILVSKLNPWTNRVVWGIPIENQICSTEFVAMELKNNKNKAFLFITAKTNSFIDYCTRASTGTSHSHRRVNPEVMMNYHFAYNANIAEMFSKITENNFNQIAKNIEQNRKLIVMRDKLLPLLMNGQVVVK